jgi:aspartyl-tRNA(Asn)/glutamyl-tRNA(Gln) amidotransferase subunit A
MIAIFNLVGRCPVLIVPFGITKGGSPIGLSICGRRFIDCGVLHIGAAIEKLKP